jgi:hypothetical protein
MALEKKQLIKIVGEKNVRDDEETLQTYAQDQSFAPKRKPDFIVFAETVEDVQHVVKLANETLTPVIPYSSGLNFRGAALPDHGGIILNLTRMNRILEINDENWFVVVEPGVTYEQLQEELMQKGYRLMIPFGSAPRRSALTSYLERDPVMAAASVAYGNFLILDTEVVLPDGELFRTGLWACGGSPGGTLGPVRNQIFRLWTGAQGTLGIMTKMVMQINPIINERKVFFLTFDKLADAIEPLKRIQRKEIGLECFLLNRFNMAALLSDDWEVPSSFPTVPKPSRSFDNLMGTLPPWIMTICISGAPRHPEEKILYEENALREVCDGLNIPLHENLPHERGIDRIMLDTILRPWRGLKKFNYRGSVHNISFKSPLKRITDMEQVMHRVCEEHGYDQPSLGGYILPLERGRGVHCEFDLHCDLNDNAETQKVKDLWTHASEALMNNGAFFDRPYGAWAEMVFQRSGNHTVKLREIKKELDPNGIMNPGKLCF